MVEHFLARSVLAAVALGGGAFSFTQSPASNMHARGPFIPRPTRQRARTSTARTASGHAPLRMCICINCARVTNCSAYHFVEERHKQPHVNKNPTWAPRSGSPTINVHIRPDTTKKAEKELEQLWEEHEDETRRAEAAAGGANGTGADAPLMGEKRYNLSGTTSYEYDVVECQDFVRDDNAWVRNMPEEIRMANPNFVPT